MTFIIGFIIGLVTIPIIVIVYHIIRTILSSEFIQRGGLGKWECEHCHIKSWRWQWKDNDAWNMSHNWDMGCPKCGMNNKG